MCTGYGEEKIIALPCPVFCTLFVCMLQTVLNTIAMLFPNVFESTVSDLLITRLNNLNAQTAPKWGKMDVAQMLAHCNVTYEMAYTDKHPKPGFLMGLINKAFIKGIVTGPKPYKPNSPTASAFEMTSPKNFEQERDRLVKHIRQTQALGEAHFEGKKSLVFGAMTANEWNTQFYKHLDHHLTQFGV